MFICHSPLTTYEKPLAGLHKLIEYISETYSFIPSTST